MIEYLRGNILCRQTNGVILDVSGVGYGLDTPLNTLCELPEEGKEVSLWVFTRVREDALKLYGFLTPSERQTFSVLLQISGVGPKVALAIMSTLTVETLKHAIETAVPEVLEVVPGIGRRTAEKILLELKTKSDKLASPVSQKGATSSGKPLTGGAQNKDLFAAQQEQDTLLFADLKSALMNLGFKEKDVTRVVQIVFSENSERDFSILMKKTLLELRSHKSPSKTKASSKNEILERIF